MVACEWQGMPAFVKRLVPRHPAERVLLSLGSALLRRWLMGAGTFRSKRSTPRAEFEVVRLLELGRAGERVPRVLARTGGAFVIESVGTSLEALLLGLQRGAPRDQCAARAADDLAQFHRRGHWHGCAQIRNVGVCAEGLARFDFDRDLDLYFPLPVLQALDAVLFLSSLESLHDESALRAAAQAYFAAAPADAMVVLRKAAGAIQRLAHSTFLHRVAPKEAARVRVLASALS